MSGDALYDFGGLVTAPGLLARNPASCVACSNVTFPIAGVMRKRRGFVLAAITATGDYSPYSLMTSKDIGGVLAFAADSAFVQGLVHQTHGLLTTTAATQAFGNYDYAELAVLGAGHYVASNMVVRVESNFTSFEAAGIPRGLAPITYSMDAAVYSVLTGAPGLVLADGSNAAYRVTWHKYDYSKNYLLGGPPSSRLVVRNIAGTSGYVGGVVKNVVLRIPLPFLQDSLSTKLGTTYFWRLWRSRASTAETADDEMYLVDEAFVTAADVTAGYAVVTDVTPDAYLVAQPRLHTNSVNFPEAGLLNGQAFADEAPPSAGHVAVYQGSVFFGNCSWRGYKQLQMFALPTVNDTLTILHNAVSVILKCVAGAPANPGEYTLVSGLATLSLNIEATCRNLVDAYTRAASTGCKALYLSQGAQNPGIIAFEAATNTGFAFTGAVNFKASSTAAGAIFRPAITAAAAGEDVNQVTKTNVVCFSKPGRGDAVPPCNQLTVGPSASSILKMVEFRERLMVFTDAGVYEINGTDYSNFGVSIVDSSLRLAAHKTVVVLEDRVYAWCREGIAEFSDGGRIIISAPIEPTITAIEHSINGTSVSRYLQMDSGFFAVASHKNHTVRFFYDLTGTSPPVNTATWIEWDARARKWSAGTFGSGSTFSCGIARYSDGAVVMGSNNAVTNRLMVFAERDTDTSADFVDDNETGLNSVAITSSATFQFQVPGVDSRQHWQELAMQFENGEQTFYPRPTVIGLKWESDTTALSGATSVTLTSPIVRVETPTAYRRSTRQRVTFTHALAEHFGLLVLCQDRANSRSEFPK